MKTENLNIIRITSLGTTFLGFRSCPGTDVVKVRFEDVTSDELRKAGGFSLKLHEIPCEEKP